MHAAMFELMRGDVARVAANASKLARLADEHDLSLWRAFGVFLQGWVAAQSGELAAGIVGMRRGLDLLGEQNAVIFSGLLKVAQAEAEAAAGDADRAVAILDEALTTSERTAHRAFDAELHRVRGEILLKRDPADPALSEQALLTAIAVAKQQGTRSFELRAALSLAKLYQSIARPAEAHAALAPALDGFPLLPSGRRAGDEGPSAPGDGAEALTPDPSPERERGDAAHAEMPEITEAQALLAALSESEEVRAEAARRQRLTQLQVAYGNALFAARGYSAPETTEAFARARELASGDKGAPERLAANWVCGSEATCGATCHPCGRTQRPSSATSRRDPIRPRPASLIAAPASIACSPASIARRGIIWNARSPCSSPAATTI